MCVQKFNGNDVFNSEILSSHKQLLQESIYYIDFINLTYFYFQYFRYHFYKINH